MPSCLNLSQLVDILQNRIKSIFAHSNSKQETFFTTFFWACKFPEKVRPLSNLIYLHFRMEWKFLLFLLCSQVSLGKCLANLPPPCDSDIYCISSNTSLLHVVQMARLYKDSKTFVDMAIKTTPQQVLANFEKLMKVSFTRFLSFSEISFTFLGYWEQTLKKSSPGICRWKLWRSWIWIWRMDSRGLERTNCGLWQNYCNAFKNFWVRTFPP